MRVISVHIKNLRCLHDLKLEMDDLTVLIGANGTGKSSFLRALKWFFEGGPLSLEDACGRQEDAKVSVGVTLSDLTEKDQEALGSYATGGTATFWRAWSSEGGENLTGGVMAYPPFIEIREYNKAADLKRAYTELRINDPSINLPIYKNAEEARKAMRHWESSNEDKLIFA